MAWNSWNDPWGNTCNKQKVNKKGGDIIKEDAMKPTTPLLDAQSTGINMKALAVAQHLMVANMTPNRQCHAASTSALFNLVMQASTRTVDTGSNSQKNMEVFKEEHGDPTPIGLATTTIPENGDEHDVALDIPGVETLHVALAGKGLELLPVDSLPSLDSYAFTAFEPVRLDTGTEYVKLPLSTYLKIHRNANGKAEVSRISGSANEAQKHGSVLMDGIKTVPKQYVPQHVLFAESFTGKDVRLDAPASADLAERPYYDAGPNSRFLEPDAVVKVKDVQAEYTSVNLLKEDGSTIGYGRIRTCFLKGAELHSDVEPAGG